MQPHTPVALGFTTGLEVLCGGAVHAQPGAQTPASAAAAYNTPLTTLRGAGRMPDSSIDMYNNDVGQKSAINL